MSWNLIDSDSDGAPSNPAIGLIGTGADIIFINAVVYNVFYTPPLLSGDVTDNLGNTYILLSSNSYQTSAYNTTGIWYCKNAISGSPLNITLNRSSIYSGIVGSVWSGSDLTAPFRDENGANDNNPRSSFATGLAGANTDLLIAGLGVASNEADAATEVNGFTLINRISYASAGHQCAQMWYKIASAAEEANFNFSPSPIANVVNIASFKLASAPAGGHGMLLGQQRNRLVY